MTLHSDLMRNLRGRARNPEWDKAGRFHDWRNHIGVHVKELWDTFTQYQQMALILDADERASKEEWEWE